MEASDKQKKKAQPQQKPRLIQTRWVATITCASFLLSVVMSYVSNEALSNANTVLSFAVLFLFIALGILFDMIGVAATSATEKEFHSMAAHKVRGAREAVWMSRNAEKVSSICNDVVGDICGMISAMTIGGKAAGKGVAIAFSSKVLALCGRVLSLLPVSFDSKKS